MIISMAAISSSTTRQEKALTGFLRETERQLHANGAFDYIGRTVNGMPRSQSPEPA